MIYFVEDSYAGSQCLAAIRRAFADPSLLELNTTTLEGARLTVDELIAAADAMPFLAEKRLVIVRRLLTRYDSRSRDGKDGEGERGSTPRAREDSLQLLNYLRRVPPTTELVFVEPSLAATNPIVKAAGSLGAKVVRQEKLEGAALEDWLVERAAELGARLTDEATRLLAGSTEKDIRALVGELEKLATYAGDQPIRAEDVRALVPETHEAEIFQFTDALSSRNRRLAFQKLRELQAVGAAFPYLLVMIARQIRLLWRARELADERADVGKAASELKLPPRVARDLLQQSRRLSQSELANAYRLLAELDTAFKNGLLSEDAALDLLVVDLTGR